MALFLALAGTKLFSNCILDVKRHFVFFSVLIIAEALQITFIVLLLLTLISLFAAALFLLPIITLAVPLHQLVELLATKVSLIALAILNIHIDILVVYTFCWQHTC